MTSYSIENNIVYKTRTLPSGSVVKSGFGNVRKTDINTDNLSGVIFKWLKFDLNENKYTEDTENTETFIVDVSGQVVTVLVGETLELDIQEPGSHTIKTINDNATNDSVEVVISA